MSYRQTVPDKSVSNDPSIEEFVDKAKRAFALKKYEESVENYATALEKT